MRDRPRLHLTHHCIRIITAIILMLSVGHAYAIEEFQNLIVTANAETVRIGDTVQQ